MAVPDFKTFSKRCRAGRVIPIYEDRLVDTATPISILASLRGEKFLLESVEGGEKIRRFSVVGAQPWGKLVSTATQTVFTEYGGKTRIIRDNPIDAVAKVIGSFDVDKSERGLMFHGGAVGYIGYETISALEPRVKPAGPALEGFPLARFMLCDTFVIFDHLQHRARLVACARPDGAGRSAALKAWDDAMDRLAMLRDAVLMSPNLRSISLDASVRDLEVEDLFPRRRFLAAVRSCKEYIRAGDIIQVVPSRRVNVKCPADPLDVYRSLRTINPSPYMFYLDFNDSCVLGASPEMLVRAENGNVRTRPIAGTRKRGDTESVDRAMEEELVNDPKERAEHVMLVDLGRNDLGRVCRPSTVKVENFMSVERFSHVMHLVSDVTGTLAGGKTPSDALKACFPAGTLSGAPKIRAMEIISELEPVARGPYGGAVGYFDYSGTMDTCITIRSVTMRNGVAGLQAGAGIVNDSVPELEFVETENKLAAMRQALGLANAGRLGKGGL